MAKDRIKNITKIALAYSGGLDTSIIIPWLKERYPGAEVIGVCINTGQEEDWAAIEKKAYASGASKLHIVDAREEFARDYVFPLIRAGALYENKYFLGTSIARPLQAKHQVRIALEEGCQAVAHGCTGKGNDQVRFELTYRALAPQLEIIAPWRVWDIRSREQAIEFAQKHDIPLGNISKKNIYSRDWNSLHMSHEGGILEDPKNRPEESMFLLTKSPKDAPDQETEVAIDFEAGVATALNGKQASPLEILDALNDLGAANGIGRTDLIESRVMGMKSRGIYETPGGTILYQALRELEMMSLSGESIRIKQQLALEYANMVYAGKWYNHERISLEAYMKESMRYTSGTVRLALYKGNVIVVSREATHSLYSEDLASFGESNYDHKDAEGFIMLYGLPTIVEGRAHNKNM